MRSLSLFVFLSVSASVSVSVYFTLSFPLFVNMFPFLLLSLFLSPFPLSFSPPSLSFHLSPPLFLSPPSHHLSFLFFFLWVLTAVDFKTAGGKGYQKADDRHVFTPEMVRNVDISAASPGPQ